MGIGSSLGYLVSLIFAGLTGHRIAKSMRGPDTRPREVAVVTARGLGSGGLQLASAICRHYWPIALLAALLSRHCRQTVLVAAVVDGVVDWLRHDGCAGSDVRPIGLPAYMLLKRIDDLAYGAGLWSGVLRERHFGALMPQIRI
jgi:hypothetical protein